MQPELTQIEAQAVARALAAVAAADGAVLDREVAYLEGFGVRHGVAVHAHVADPLDPEALARAVTDPAKRKEVVRLCLEIAVADREYAPAEAILVSTIAAALEVSDDDLQALTAAALAR